MYINVGAWNGSSVEHVFSVGFCSLFVHLLTPNWFRTISKSNRIPTALSIEILILILLMYQIKQIHLFIHSFLGSNGFKQLIWAFATRSHILQCKYVRYLMRLFRPRFYAKLFSSWKWLSLNGKHLKRIHWIPFKMNFKRMKMRKRYYFCVLLLCRIFDNFFSFDLRIIFIALSSNCEQFHKLFLRLRLRWKQPFRRHVALLILMCFLSVTLWKSNSMMPFISRTHTLKNRTKCKMSAFKTFDSNIVSSNECSAGTAKKN